MSGDGISPSARQIYVALDFPTADEALALTERLAPLGVGLKVGLQLYTSAGPPLMAGLRDLAPRSSIFLDLKFHDIPATVAGAVGSTARLGAAVLNLHLSGGEAMVHAALATRDEIAADGPAPKLIGVTVLTSLDGEDLKSVWGAGVDPDPAAQALRLAELALRWGLDGVVASAKEASAIRAACGPEFLIVTPGIRPAGSAADDQKRVLTPAEALTAGASHLVIGRPVTRASDPVEACRLILADMAGSLS